MVFDLIFVGIFLMLEIIYYVSFRKHETQVHDDLTELSKRLELLIEGIDMTAKMGDNANHEDLKTNYIDSHACTDCECFCPHRDGSRA